VTLAAIKPTKTKTAPKQRKPEEVWYDVHKHPAGVPGGMGKAPEHHLRQRGWSGHEINESAGRKTIQYRNHQYPDFVVSYGGGTSQKPDHNFRVLYLGTNANIPKITRSYSVAEAMNKVEELHQLQSGLVVQPMTHGAASLATQPNVTRDYTFVAPIPKKRRRDMTKDEFHPIGAPDPEFPTSPDKESDWREPQKQLQEIPDPPKPKPKKPVPVRYGSGPSRIQNDHGTIAGGGRHKAAGEVHCPLCRKAGQVYRKDPVLYRDLIHDGGGLTDEHLHTTSPFHDRVQAALVLRRGKPPRHPEGLGPADLGRQEYNRQYREKQRSLDDADVAELARGYGMDISPDEVANYPRLRKVISVFQRAEQETWEEA